MKEIKAYIKPQKLDAVIHALQRIEGLSGVSTVHGGGVGRSRGESERHHLEDELDLLAPHVKVEVVCSDDLAEKVIAVIQEHAHTGRRGDGKIYVSRIEAVVRIATGERDEDAT